MTTITLSSRGQIVIPAHIREKLKLSTGDQLLLDFNEEAQELTLQRVESIDEMSTRFNSWIKPDTVPLEDVRGLYDTREPRI
jgi:AbrB family looped-hinge helix DNA binding protein